MLYRTYNKKGHLMVIDTNTKKPIHSGTLQQGGKLHCYTCKKRIYGFGWGSLLKAGNKDAEGLYGIVRVRFFHSKECYKIYKLIE